jgi:adiponectin receptor
VPRLASIMAVQQRQVPESGSKVESITATQQPVHKRRPKNKRQLLLASEVPAWLATNPFLLTGYRPVYGSVALCLDSLTFVHNETVNIYSHLIPAIIALVSNYFLNVYWRDRYPTAAFADQLAIHAYLTTSVLCFGISSTYHTLDCHSKALSGLWNRLDYAAIILQTVGSFVSGIYITFYCMPGLQKLYWTMVSLPLPDTLNYSWPTAYADQR